MTDQIARWRRDPVAFVEGVLIDPQTGRPFTIYPDQRRFLRVAFTPRADGSLPYPEILMAAIKKSGKTATAAMMAHYAAVALDPTYAEVICVANDLEQAQGRVFRAAARMVEASPLLRAAAKVYSNVIEFPSTGATITAIASDFAGAAGGAPTLAIFDEMWAFGSERLTRLYDELVPVPTRRVSARFVVSHAGFEGESKLLRELWDRGLAGEEVEPNIYAAGDLLMFYCAEPVAPWQTEEWKARMRRTLRPSAYSRMIANVFTAGESIFVPMEAWDACVAAEVTPVLSEPERPVWVGVDASTKRDSTALVAVSWEGRKIRLLWHRIFRPSPEDPLDFESTIEGTLLDLQRRFSVRAVRFDPYQMAAVSQRLARAGVPMVEFPQSLPNLTAASSNLFELVKGRNLVVYPDDEIRLAVSHSVALETSRGWRIAKEKAAHKIDVVIALAMATLAAVEAGQPTPGVVESAASFAIPDVGDGRPDFVRRHLRSLGFDETAGEYRGRGEW